MSAGHYFISICLKLTKYVGSVTIYCVAIRAELRNPSPDFRPSELKTVTPVTPVLLNVHTNFGSSAPFCFRDRTLYGTDGRTDGRAGPVLWPIRTAGQRKLIYMYAVFKLNAVYSL